MKHIQRTNPTQRDVIRMTGFPCGLTSDCVGAVEGMPRPVVGNERDASSTCEETASSGADTGRVDIAVAMADSGCDVAGKKIVVPAATKK